jgi:hypothetical protein
MARSLGAALLRLGTTIGAGLLVVARASALTWTVPDRPDTARTPPTHRASDSR